MQGVDVRKREAVPHGAADDWLRVVFRQDGAEHVERADIGRGLAASVRVRGKNEVCKRLPQHGGNKYTKSAARGEVSSWEACQKSAVGPVQK